MSRRPRLFTLSPFHFAVIAVALGLLLLLSAVVLFPGREQQVPPAAPALPKPAAVIPDSFPETYRAPRQAALPPGVPVRLTHVTSDTLRKNVGRLVTLEGMFAEAHKQEFTIGLDHGQWIVWEPRSEHPAEWFNYYAGWGGSRVRITGILQFTPGSSPRSGPPPAPPGQGVPPHYYFVAEESTIERVIVR